MPIGSFIGGALVTVENGLVVELTSGDFTVFPSQRVTHLNMPYVGKRASLVCHTDREGQSWVRDRNGWVVNSYLNDEQAWGAEEDNETCT